MINATPEVQPPAAQPLAVWNPTRGIWVKPQLDLFGQQEQFWETWPTSGMTRNGSVYPLPTSAHPTPDSGSSSSPTALFRTPLASDASRGGESLQQVRARRGTIALSHQIIDLALQVTSRCVVENLDIVRDQLCVDYAALSSGMATSSSWVLRSFMECSLK